MSDEVETMFSVREVPWHKKGLILDMAPRSAEEAIRLSGLDWNVSLRQVFSQETIQALLGEDAEADNEEEKLIPDELSKLKKYRAVFRDSDNKCLGIVTDRYRVLQNRQAFSFFDPIMEHMRGSYETAGSLFGGRVIWVLVRLEDAVQIGKNDELRPYLLLANGHAGRMNVIVQPTDVRVVCNNTLQMSLGHGLACRLRHTEALIPNLERIQEQIIKMQMQRKDRYASFMMMQQHQVTESDMVQFVATLFPYDIESAAGATIAMKKRELVQRLIQSGQGTEIPGVRGTAWGLYNAVTEYVDWYAANGTQKVKDKTAYVLMGAGADLKERAYRAAMALVAR